MPDIDPTLVGAIAGAVGTAIGAAGTVLVNLIFARSKTNLAERDATIAGFERLVNQLQEQVTANKVEVNDLRARYEADIQVMWAKYTASERENAELKMEVKHLKIQVQRLEQKQEG